MQQVLLNLLSNAIKFSAFCGKIIIRIKKVLGEDGDQDFLQVSVTDNGMGIRNKDKKRLFKLYSAIKS